MGRRSPCYDHASLPALCLQVSPSFTQREVLRVLQQLPGCEGALLEHSTDDGLMRMDIALPLPAAAQQGGAAGGSRRCGGGRGRAFEGRGREGGSSSRRDDPVGFQGIAIEVDGPTHFLNSHPDEPDGTSQVNRVIASAYLPVVIY